jgi:stage V sporulation protein AC
MGFFDKIAKFGCGGALVPISGFANAITSEAIESKSEGFVTGVATKIFTIAGPVLVYGVTASILYGVLYYIFIM